MNKQEALEKTMELLGIDSKDQLALDAYQLADPNTFRYCSKKGGSTIVEVIKPTTHRDDGWTVRKL